MKDKIDKDFYCSAGFDEGEFCFRNDNGYVYCDKEKCSCYHRKHPTPKEFKEEYGFDVPDDMPVWFRKYVPDKFVPTDWRVSNFGRVKKRYIGRYVDIVCACTPFGKPDDTWRPENGK